MTAYGSDARQGTTSHSAEKFADGTVLQTLQKYCTDNVQGQVWTQKIGTEQYPVFYTSDSDPASTYIVKVTSDGNGTASAAPQSGASGTEVTLCAIPGDNYRFKEWQVISGGVSITNNKFTIGTADVHIKAVFEEIPVTTHKVTWLNHDGTVLETDEAVAYGTTPTYDGETPTKARDAQYTYTFAGWSPAVSAVSGDATYTATFTATVNTYTVTWLNHDGMVLETDESVAYGTTPTYDDETPVKAPDAKYTYTFAGWSPSVSAVSGDVTYTATFTATVNTYTVTWLNLDGTVLETDEAVPFGTTPTYDGETPTKAPDAQYTYTFAGWSPAVSAVSGDVTYTATFTAIVNTYTVTWKNHDGAVLETDEAVAYGTTPTYDDETPVKTADVQYTYTFAGWSPAVSAVSGDATYTATFTSTVNSYTVTWLNHDGSVLETDEAVPFGTTPTYDGETPTKATDAQYTYTFAGWSPDVTCVSGDATYTSTFTAIVNTYTVTWLNHDGTVLETDEAVAYGTTPTYDGETPVKTADVQYTYTFAGWSPAVSAVSGDVTYTATFTATVNTYTVTWLNHDGMVLETDESVAYGTTPTYDGETPAKAPDAQYTYTFAGWSPAVSAASGDATYTATFTATVNTYTVTWLNHDGMVLETDEAVAYGTTPAYDGETPVKTADVQYTYTFAGWSPSVSAVSGDVTYTATYSAVVNAYTVTWLNHDGMVLETDEAVPFGTTPTYDGETPVKTANVQYTYTFAGWSPAVSAVSGDATYTATFTSTVNAYTVTWLNHDGMGLETDEAVAYGTTPTYDGETPVKTADAQYTYTFTGWSPAVSSVSGDATYTAQFISIANKYTVTVHGGMGGGQYAAGEIVSVSAKAPPDDMKFDKWQSVNGLTISLGAETTSTLNFVMPAHDVVLSATYQPVEIPVEAILLNANHVELNIGELYVMRAELLPSSATNQNVTWHSSNPAVATIRMERAANLKVVIIARSSGTAVISTTTEDGGHQAACTVNVVADVPPLEVAAGESAVAVVEGSRVLMTVTACGGDAPYQYQWFADDGDGFAPCAGANEATYTTPPVELSNDGEQYFCRVTDQTGYSVDSAIFVLNVTEVPQTGDEAPALLWMVLFLGSLSVLLLCYKSRKYG
ncbi:MAG: Ig domain-containing protein [Clostridiales bacterium]|nr:Ig domain-containing protein [Clostridiales bacterium]